jgi:hypothetical protein
MLKTIITILLLITIILLHLLDPKAWKAHKKFPTCPQFSHIVLTFSSTDICITLVYVVDPWQFKYGFSIVAYESTSQTRRRVVVPPSI